MIRSILEPDRQTPFLFPALALWGWQAGLLPWALLMGLLFEAPRFSKLRFEIHQTDFNRLWNFTTLLFLGMALYLFLARQGFQNAGTLAGNSTVSERLESVKQVSQTAIHFLRWLPFIFFPLILAHAWSNQGPLPWSTFSLYRPARARRSPDAEPDEWAIRRVHPGYPFLGIVLFASSTSVEHPSAYLPLFLLATVLALWPWRNRHYGIKAWIGLFLLLASCAFIAQHSLTAIQLAWRAMENRLMQGAGGTDFDQIRNATALGLVGRLKQSGRIVLRIETQDDGAPGLLREAAYNRFRSNIWASKHREFISVSDEGDGVTWRFAPSDNTGRQMTIARYTFEGEVPLALPGDTQTIRSSNAEGIKTNYMAATRLLNAPAIAIYSVEHGKGGGFNGDPEPDDTSLDTLLDDERAAIQTVANDLGLAGLSPPAAIGAVQRYFASNFEYSIWQRPRRQAFRASPLAVFLLESRSGHCEFFATATALLLRTAGVPTRYAVGYSPSDNQNRRWLARGRDAHAWCLVYVDGQWRDFDTTPGVWREREAARAAWWDTIRDRISNARYRFDLWRQQGGNWRVGVFTGGLIVLGWLAWKQLRGSRWRRAEKAREQAALRLIRFGLDSELLGVLQRLETIHGPRHSHETPLDWMRRLHLGSDSEAGPLREALRLHDRLRFDPSGLPAPDRNRLRQLSADLEKLINLVLPKNSARF